MYIRLLLFLMYTIMTEYYPNVLIVFCASREIKLNYTRLMVIIMYIAIIL